MKKIMSEILKKKDTYYSLTNFTLNGCFALSHNSIILV